MKDQIKQLVKGHLKEGSFQYRIIRSASYRLRYCVGFKRYFRTLQTWSQVAEAETQKHPTTIWYFGIPTHNNLGDQAQKLCIEKWIRSEFPDAAIVKIDSDSFNFAPAHYCRQIERLLRSNDIFLMQSGYTFDGMHENEVAHEIIPHRFPNNRIVVMPNTIGYRDPVVKRRVAKSINGHHRLLFLARDAISYETALELFPSVTCRLCPDIVTTLIGSEEVASLNPSQRKGILLCLRNDREKLVDDADIVASIESRFESMAVSITDTTIENMPHDDIALQSYIYEVIREYASHRVIVTDRYHGTIFALVSGTPVIVLPTNDHKVVTGVQWFERYLGSAVYLATSREELPSLIQEAISSETPASIQGSEFRQAYKDVADLVRGL